MPSLILIKSPGGSATGQAFPLNGGDLFVIGRDAEQCQIVIPNSAVSRKHAQITRNGTKYVIEDLGSRNGTIVNNNKVATPTSLKNEDRVKICDFLFRFHDESVAPRPLINPQEAPEEEEGGLTTVQEKRAAGGGAQQQLLEVQTADRLRAILEVSGGLSKTLDLDPLLTQIAETLFKTFKQADRCFVILLDESGRMIPKVVKARRPGSHEDHRFSKTIIRNCLETMSSYLSEDASAEAGLASQSIAEFRIRSVMCAPLATADGKKLGAIQLDTQDARQKFNKDDLDLLTIVANLSSVALENAQMHAEQVDREKERKEVEVARKVQVGFLPKTFPDLPGYEFFAFYSPAQSVGGDYYDFITLPQGRVAVVLGDVAGKGVAAALLMAKLSAEVRFCMLTEPDPAKSVTLLNDQLIRGGIGDRFVTLAVLVIDPAAHQVTVVNAGHINPMKLTAKAEFAEVISNKESGLPVGLTAGYPYLAKVVPLEAGDTLLVLTDGVTDAESPALLRFQQTGIAKAVLADATACRPQAVGDRLVKAVQRHAAGHPQSDDIALVCFGRVDGAAAPRPPDPRATPRQD